MLSSEQTEYGNGFHPAIDFHRVAAARLIRRMLAKYIEDVGINGPYSFVETAQEAMDGTAGAIPEYFHGKFKEKCEAEDQTPLEEMAIREARGAMQSLLDNVGGPSLEWNEETDMIQATEILIPHRTKKPNDQQPEFAGPDLSLYDQSQIDELRQSDDDDSEVLSERIAAYMPKRRGHTFELLVPAISLEAVIETTHALFLEAIHLKEEVDDFSIPPALSDLESIEEIMQDEKKLCQEDEQRQFDEYDDDNGDAAEAA